MVEEYTTISISYNLRTQLKHIAADRNCDYNTVVQDLLCVWNETIPYKTLEEFKTFVLKNLGANVTRNVQDQDANHILIKGNNGNFKRFEVALTSRNISKKDIDGYIIPNRKAFRLVEE